MRTFHLVLLLGLNLFSCKSVDLDLSDLASPVMLNADIRSEANIGDLASEDHDYTGTASTHEVTHGFNGGGTVTTRVNDAQEAAFTLVGGSTTAGITGVSLLLRSSSTYPLLWVSQFIEIKAQGSIRNEQ